MSSRVAFGGGSVGSAAVARDRWLAVGVAAVVCGVVGWAGRDGVGLSPDSLEYLGVARNLLDGHGLTVPFGSVVEDPQAGGAMTNFPPLYPLLLAIGGGGLVWARVLALLLLAVTAGCVTLLVRRHAVSRPAAVGIALLLCAPDFVRVHSMAWSEPVLLAAIAAGSLALAEHLARPTRRATWVALLALAAAAPMARYAGVAFVVAVVVALGVRRRWRDAGWAAAAGLLPLAGWLAYGAQAASTGRVLAWHPPSWDALSDQVARTTTFWLSGYGPRFALAAAALLLLAAAPTARPAPAPPMRDGGLVAGVVVLVGGVVVVLLATWALLDRTTVLDSRLLVAAHLGVVLALPFVVRPARRWQTVALAMAAVLVVAGGVRFATRFPDSGSRQYAHQDWRRSPTLAAAKRAAAVTGTATATRAAPTTEGRLLSNAPELVWWTTDQPVDLLPAKHDFRSGKARPWPRHVAAIPAGATIVVLDRVPRAHLATPQDIATIRTIILVQRLPDGAVYRLP
jgi:hypothetical protein